MTDRFDPTDIIVAHFKGLKNRRYDRERPIGVPDRAARYLLYVAPLAVGAVVLAKRGHLAGPDGVLAAAGILLAAFLMSFTQIAIWRERLTARRLERAQADVHQRDSLDEATAHLMMAMYACVALTVDVVIGKNFATDKGDLSGVTAAIASALGTYLVLLLLIIIPKLYSAYAQVNELDDEMSGLSH